MKRINLCLLASFFYIEGVDTTSNIYLTRNDVYITDVIPRGTTKLKSDFLVTDLFVETKLLY